MNVRAMVGAWAAAVGVGVWGGEAPGQFASRNIELKAWLPLSAFAGSPTSGNDCWGYVSPSGREYAIIGLRNGAGFVEITDAANPRIVATIPHASALNGCVKVYQHYAYVGTEGGGGVQVIDMSGIDAGAVTLLRTFAGTSEVHTLAVDEVSGFLYLCGGGPTRGIRAYSLADPANPAYVRTGDPTTYVHEAQVVTYTTGPYAGRQIAFCCVGEAGLDIVDMAVKSAPVRLSRLAYTGVSYCHQGWLSEDRTLLYINDELDEVRGRRPTATTYVINVEDLAAPWLVSTFTTGLRSVDHNLYVKGRFIFESNYSSGLRIFDARNPTNPTEVGWFDTYPEEHEGLDFEGAWSNFPYFPSGHVIVSDINRGLFVFDPRAALECLEADLSADGIVSWSDYLEYLNLYDASDPAADLDGDSFVDLADYLMFLEDFERGCE